MVDGLGGAIFNLLGGNPMGQLSQALAGPQPGSQTAASGSNQLPSPGTQAQAQATQSPPDLAQLYLRLAQSQALGDSFNRNLAMFAGGFKGPPGGAETIMRGVTGGGSQDAGAMLQNLLQMRNMQAMQAAIPGMLKAAGLDASYAPLAMANPDFLAKVVESQTGVNADLNTRQYLAAKKEAEAAGQTFPDFATWTAQHQAAGTSMQTQAEDAQKFKDSAVADYTTAHAKLTELQPYIDTLIKNPDATRRAMSTSLPATGIAGTWDPLLPQDVKDAAIALAKVRASLKGEALQGFKNVRNLNEFNTLGQAATAGLDPNASDTDFKNSLAALKNKTLDALATSEMSVGHKLTGDLVGHGNRDLLLPTINGKPNPYYNGATEEALKPLAGSELDQVKQTLATHPERRDEILKTVRKNGYDPGGL